uniref:Uncharacterized protein n=1 Tax=Globisporangium ultimum (strain ATCC 200006 / CBS 805.95 / DAOM BR144) TaxID=431595 RepID=K3X0S3_GLOUD
MDAANATDSSSLAEDSPDTARGSEESSPAVSTSSFSSASRSTSGDTCAFYGQKIGESCRQLRTCYDCLNAKVGLEPNGCVISPTGLCQSMNSYVTSMDYRNTGLSSSVAGYNTTWDVSIGSFNMFPSSNATYCKALGDACVQCYAVANNASRADDLLTSTTSTASVQVASRRSHCTVVALSALRETTCASQWRAMQEELIEQEKEKPPELPALAASTLDIERVSPA